MSETCRAFYHQLFGVRRSVRYHQRRQSYFEACHTFIAALQVIFGSSAVAAILSNSGIWVGVSLAAVPPLLASVDLVFGTSRRATLHASLGRRFSQLEADMVPHEVDSSTLGSDGLTRFQQRRLSIEADEPPKLRVVDLLSHNDLVRSTYTHGSIYPIGLLWRTCGHAFDVNVDKALSSAAPYQPFESGAAQANHGVANA